MESALKFHSGCGEESNDPRTRKQRNKLGSILNFEKHENDNFHPKNVEKSKGFHQKQQVERKLYESEEVVKYMSYLPSYLERGEMPHEKPFNIGVLDWRLLEKWQRNHDDVSPINRRTVVPESKAENHRSLQASSSSFYGGASVKFCNTEFTLNHTHFNSLSRESGKIKDSQVELSSSQKIRGVNCPSGKEQTRSVPVSPSRKKNLEKNLGPMPRNLAGKVKDDIPESTKVRNPSPTRRFSFGLGRTGKSANSSPLRRLLDPLMTNRTVNSLSLKRESSVKVKLDSKGCRTDDIGGPQKFGSPKVQALLQVSVKNGHPLFTFTVDDCSDILAATVKEISSKEATQGWVYTFFSFREMKKKNAHWINQERKDSNHGYVSNIVAQMKASDIVYTDPNGRRSPRVREFVLSSVGVRDQDLQTSNSLPGDELAAFVIKFSERSGGQLNQYGNKLSRTVRSCSGSRNDKGNESASVDGFSATVILPGGDHGVPSKGEPSPLIERWKSGGSCDCGGWDLGCRIRVLANNNQLSQRLNSAKSQCTAFKLFSQEEVEENKPMFILSPFEDGIFSVEFDSSLNIVQAFSIGIAVLNSRTSTVLSSNMFRGKISEEITSNGDNSSNIFNGGPPAEVSAKYFSYPPLSPAGRV